jgi:glycosyltransferase involved in cell wall biosynthesis
VLNPWTWWKAAQAIVSLQPSFVVLQWWTTILAAPLAALARLIRRSGTPVVYLVHNVLPHERRSVDHWLTRWALGAGDGFVVLSDQEESSLRRLLPRAGRIRVCPIPSFDLFEDGRGGREAARRQLSMPLDVPIVLFFGFVRRYKGVMYLLDALAELKADGRRVLGLIVGEIWHGRRDLLEKIRRLDLGDSVRLEDRYIPNEEVGLFFSAADLFVAPYTAGTASGPVTIAAQYGLPIVATETIRYGLTEVAQAGLQIVPPRNAGALARAIARMLESPPVSPIRGVTAQAGWKRMFHALVSVSQPDDR